MAVYKMESNGLPPNKWPVVKVADISGDEEFVKQMLELHQIVDATTIMEQRRKEVKEAITAILMDGLSPAFLEPQQIRASRGREMPLMNREQPYEDLVRKLWKSYKGLLDKAARLMDFKVGFRFKNDKEFHEGLAKFRRENPGLRDGFEKFLEDTRDEWQIELAEFRNKWVDHPVVGDRRRFAKFYTPDYAETLFDHVWHVIVDSLPVLLELRLWNGTRLIEQHPDDPGPKWVQRFRYDVPAFRKSE